MKKKHAIINVDITNMGGEVLEDFIAFLADMDVGDPVETSLSVASAPSSTNQVQLKKVKVDLVPGTVRGFNFIKVKAKREENAMTQPPMTGCKVKKSQAKKARLEPNIYDEDRPLPTMEEVNAELINLKYDDPDLDVKLKKIQALKIKLQACGW